MAKLTNAERENWINNDEGLYNWKRSSKLSMRKFIAENKEEIDRCINNVLGNKQPAHYLAYGERR
jgi:hypothetical protein